MKEVIEYFDRSYIINLSDREDRRHQVEREFHRVGISIPSERVRFYTATRPLDKGAFVNTGIRGCFTSHRNILEIANQDNLRNVLVFEDDISFRKIGKVFLQQLIEQLSTADWDLVFFGYLQPSDEDLTGPLVQWPHDILGTHFYAVNGRFIETMLRYMNDCEARPRDHPDGGPMPVDGVYNHVRYVTPNIALLLSVPALAYQRSSRTDVSPHQIFDGISWLRPTLNGARAFKHWMRMKRDEAKLKHRLGR
jgi:GR25 family glycosyltransferase involved in LPS biosynthesis